MSTTDQGRRTAATWVAGTGAFLLLAAAAVFVGVRWEDLSPELKFAIVGGLTGAFLVTGRALSPRLPATGSVLVHLGAFLLPIDLAGLNLRLGLPWPELVLAEGVLMSAAFALLAATTGSVVLRWSAWTGVVVLASGVGAVLGPPAPLVLAGAGLIAVGVRPGAPGAAAWGLVAGLAPLLGIVASVVALDAGRLTTMGWVDAHPGAVAVTAVAAATVLALTGRHRGDTRYAPLALAVLGVGLATAWIDADLPRTAQILAGPAAFVILEAIAVLIVHDPFWGRTVRGLLVAGEVVAAFAVAGALGTIAAPVVGAAVPDPTESAAWALLAIGWLLADRRRLLVRDRWVVWSPAPLGAAVCAVAAVAAAAPPVEFLAAALVLVALVAVPSTRPFPTLVAASAALAAPTIAAAAPRSAFAVGVASAAVCGLWVVRRGASVDTAMRASATGVGALALALGAVSSVPVLGLPTAAAGFVLAAWALALLVDGVDTVAGHVARGAAVLVLPALIVADAGGAIPGAIVLTVAAVVEAGRLRRPAIAHVAAASLLVLAVDVGRVVDLGVARTGLVLCLGAVVAGGGAVLVPERWRAPAVTVTVSQLATGLVLATTEAATLAPALILAGGLAVGAGAVLRQSALGHAGGATATVGLWLHLALESVPAAEAYTAPVAVHLLVAGVTARRAGRVSSWASYAPAVGILGASALAERLGGGPGWHAVLAGTVGVLAVAVGGARRLSGPLVVGTGLLVGLTAHESVAVVATVPTWAWLALGGACLLAIGVVLERQDASPTEVGRRLVEVVAERFD